MPQIRLAFSSGPYRFWGRCIAGRFRKERSARFGKANSSSLRVASRIPFVSRAFLVFLSSDFKSLKAKNSAPLLLAFSLQILRCPSDDPRVMKTSRPCEWETPIFAKEKPRNVEPAIRSRLKNSHKGGKYGISDSSCCRSGDGPLRANHRRLPETAGMVTINRK